MGNERKKAKRSSVESAVEAGLIFLAPTKRESSADVPTCKSVNMAKTKVSDCKPSPTAATAKAEIRPTIMRSVITCNMSSKELMAAGMESLSIFWCLLGKYLRITTGLTGHLCHIDIKQNNHQRGCTHSPNCGDQHVACIEHLSIFVK